MKTVFKFRLIIICLLFSSLYSYSQTSYGNEWINPSKTYLKFKVAENGIYKVTFEEIESTGLVSGKIDGTILQLFNYGIEQAVHVSDNDFGPGDFIEFYGKKNTIGLDSFLYEDWKKDLFNPEYSLVSDSNTYFLTLSPESSNKRFTLIEPNYTNITLMPFPYYLHEEKVVFSSSFFKNVEVSKTQQSQFESSEGFGSFLQQISDINLNTTKYYEDGPLPSVKFRIGLNNQLSRLDISWNNQLLDAKILLPKKTYEFVFPLEKSQIKSSNTLNLKNTNNLDDKHRLAFANLTYPRALDFNDKSTYSFKMSASPNKRLLEISAFKHENNEAVLYDTGKNLRYKTSLRNNNIIVIINPSIDESNYVLNTLALNTKKVSNTTIFKPKDFKNEGQEYVIISKKTLYDTGPDYVKEYADYRRSAEGGSYDTEIIDVQDIYDHFGYGIDRHFYSFKKMSKYLKDFWSENKYVLLLGKSIEYPYIRTTNDILNYENKVFFIPTFGFTGSDNLLFSENNFPDPHFAVGRIAARTSDDIKNYLDKVRLYEKTPTNAQNISEKFWTKKVLHLGGGKNENEQNGIQNGLKSMAKILEDTVYGAEVFSFYKRSSESVDFNVNENINKVFNDGLALVNFFGHSSAGTWDFAIENPRNYNNLGRYPFINSFGCYSGNLHGVVKGISESFVLEKEKGAIAFFASTGTAFIGSLSNYGTKFYDNLLNRRRGESFGQIIQNLAFVNRDAKGDELSLYSQLTYHGDPSLKPYIYSRPDYIFDNASSKTTPSIILASVPDFEITVNIKNLGSAIKDSVDLLFVHLLPSGKISDSIWFKTGPIYNNLTLNIPLKNSGILSIGKNILKGIIDPFNKIKELPLPEAENNNELNIGQGFDFFVTDNYATAIYPPDYGIVNNKEQFVLKGSTSTAPIEKTKFLFQIDTTRYFNSPYLEKGNIESQGGLISFKPSKTALENVVYYWRISPDSIDLDGFKWSNSSFIYLPNEKEGWNQSHFFQLQDNTESNMSISEITKRKYEFGDENNTIILRNKLWDQDDKPGYTYNNVRFGSVTPWNYMDAGLGFVINDRNKFIGGIFNPKGGKYGSINPTSDSLRGFFFNTKTPEDRKIIMDFIATVLKDKYYINVFTILKTAQSKLYSEEWAQDSLIYGKNIFNVLEELGAKRVRELGTSGSLPYIFQAEKGVGLVNEKIAFEITDIIEGQMIVSRKKNKGEVNSTIIGPAIKWESLKIDIPDGEGKDRNSWVDVIGLDANGNETILNSTLKSGVHPLNIDPNKFPLVRLKSYMIDSLSRIPPQLNFWRTTFTTLPDAAIIFNAISPDYNTKINFGQKVKINYTIVSTNNLPMDSILVKYIFLQDDNQPKISYKKLGPLLIGKEIKDSYEVFLEPSTTNNVRFEIEINPGKVQPELYSFNNVISTKFDISKDNENPLLNLFFDGVQIMDGDIVSPKPEILITLNDDNNFLPISNPNLFEIKLDTGRFQYKIIPPDSPELFFTPADQNNKTAKLQYKPTLKEGDYRLLVQGEDASGNKSGINAKSVSFRVIEKQSVSNVLNYPNPFSTSTQFVFTLTGEQIPDIMSISIMTMSGKVVREITKEELGHLHIGINRTEYKWDGTDDYGSKLANGVYLYKVNIRKSNGDKYDHLSNSKADIFFKEGFGKMVILR